MVFERKEILVYAHWEGIESSLLIGSLLPHPEGKKYFPLSITKDGANTKKHSKSNHYQIQHLWN